MNAELLLPVFFFAAVSVVLPLIILAGVVIFTARNAMEHCRQTGSPAEKDRLD